MPGRPAGRRDRPGLGNPGESRIGVANFQLQFQVDEIKPLASRYDFDVDDEVATAGAAARQRGYYTKPELVLICEWKTVRSKSRVAKNTEEFVEGITRAAFATNDESERMAGLCVLRGVEAPTGICAPSLCVARSISDHRLARTRIARRAGARRLLDSVLAPLRRSVPQAGEGGRGDDERTRQGVVAALARAPTVT